MSKCFASDIELEHVCMLQVLERECEPDVLAKKRAKLEGKRAKAYPKVGYACRVGSLHSCPDSKTSAHRLNCTLLCMS